ncbi:phosphotransferase [Corynebacterium tuscaniense]|uniref:Phosphotransferase n=1 Tax=Corynebacterium tuscaniense TaxID=302449 RepID=A0A2N6T5U9_9CORY|nr:phosphotransferase [Corynebacterium tuscaniense]PMC64691.1 phosphotransferase [Corynebacterium tuscaniense]
MLNHEQIIDLAEGMLNHRYGGQQQLTEPEELSGTGSTTVLRLRVANNPFLSHRSVVVKYSPRTGDPIDDAAFVREVVAYQFTTSLSEDVRPGPVMLGYDLDKRAIILSDSGNGDTLATLLETSDEEQRVKLLRNLGTSLGKMHAGTAGAETSFNILLARMVKNIEGARDVQLMREGLLENRILEGLEIVRHAGIDVPANVASIADTVQVRMLHGGSRAFTPFDLSPDNILFADRTQFLDYEWAGFRDVMFDVAGVIAGFPQYISSQPLSDKEAKVFVEAWAAEVGGAWPSVNNEDTLQARITASLIGWAFFSVSILYVDGDDTLSGTRYGKGGWVVDVDSPSGQDTDMFDPQIREEDVERGAKILRSSVRQDLTVEEIAIRRDVAGTFDALARYAATGTEPTYAEISSFAASVVERLT